MAFRLSPAEAAVDVATVIDTVNAWKEHFALVGVTKRDIARLAERIDDPALSSQRSGFDPSRFQSVPARRKRSGPFQPD